MPSKRDRPHGVQKGHIHFQYYFMFSIFKKLYLLLPCKSDGNIMQHVDNPFLH